ncbi:TPA: hypothetical protein RU610_004495 [Salmonella enterica]|nr:hypothetical protein [Salmonella enterica subsp. diarizonae]HEA0263509.1 hypothetical protein [Salmonella enterica]HEA0268604.1 hypothetical protein [Salmonella enterica]HEA0295541.1 hypothetical protein [Salmonella enterica]HEA0304650.1 hypothetical protein [Salmonella enterica]
MDSIKTHVVRAFKGSTAEYENISSLDKKIEDWKKKQPEYLPSGVFHLNQQIFELHVSNKYKQQSVDYSEKQGIFSPFILFVDDERKIITTRPTVGGSRSASQYSSVISLAECKNDRAMVQPPFLVQNGNGTDDDALQKMVINLSTHYPSPVVQLPITEKAVTTTPFTPFFQPEMTSQQDNLFIYKFRNSTRNWVEIFRAENNFVLKPSNILTESALCNKLNDNTPYSLFGEHHREERGQDKDGQNEAET